MPHRVVHFEIPADDPAGLAKFYADLFGWKIHQAPIPDVDYWICRTGDGVGIDGAITKRTPERQGIVNSVAVESIDAFLDKARALGAREVIPKTAVPGMGWYALVTDPQDNPISFWERDSGAK